MTMMPSHAPLAILAVRSLRRSRLKSSLPAISSLAFGIELHELAGELLQHVVGHDKHGLVDQPGLLHLHAGRGHRETLARAHRMGEQRIAAAHGAPDGVFLVLVQVNRPVHPRKIQMRAVEAAQAQIVVGVVVEPDETFGALRIGEHPGAETLLDAR